MQLNQDTEIQCVKEKEKLQINVLSSLHDDGEGSLFYNGTNTLVVTSVF